MTTASHQRQDLIDLTVALARIDSVNPTLDPAGGGEAEVGEFVRAWMTDRGWDVAVEWPAPDRPNVIGVIKGGPGPTLMINAHLDTVGGVPEAFNISADDTRIRGRGVLDTKGGLAAALIAAASIDPADLPGDVVIAAVCDEEADSIGTSHLLKPWRPDAAIVIEPTGLEIVTGHRGFGILDATYTGLAAHTGHRDDGINAIDSMARLLGDLPVLERRLAERQPPGPVGSPSVQVTRVQGGTELFTVPDRCTASIEMRTVPGHADADLDELVRTIEARAVDGVGCEYEWMIRRPPFGVDHNEWIVRAAQAGVIAVGHEPDLTTAPFWTDAALFDQSAVPSIVFGPGGHGIHSIDEWIDIDDLVACRDTLHHVMTHFGGGAR